jgi:energy-coupling factor transport system ATP-binding protein
LAPFGTKTGEIIYRGETLEKLEPEKKAEEIGFVFQNADRQIVSEWVYQELAFGLENLGCDRQTIRRRVGEMASFFGITSWFRKPTDELSGGQKQLLNLASVMVMQPKILLLDEPTSQLDPISASEFLQTLRRLNQELGLTIIMVEHRLEEVFPIADQIVIMNDGKILMQEKPEIVGKTLKDDDLFIGLPSAVKIFHGLMVDDRCPLTVRDGKEFLSKHFANRYRAIPAEIKKEPDSSEWAIDLRDLWFRYERKEADVLRGLNLKIRQNEIFSIVGGNGSGKTTLLKVIAGIVKTYHGKVKISFDADHKSGSEKPLAFLPQNPEDLFIEETVRKELNEMGSYLGIADEIFQNRVSEVIKNLELREILGKHPYDLSGGEQQKVALAKVLLVYPRIILLDEPTKGLDARLKTKLIAILRDLKKQGKTILLVTHDIEFAARVSNRCAMIFDGEIISVAAPNQFFTGNNYYTTAASRISRHMYDQLITEEEVIALAKRNGEICEK